MHRPNLINHAASLAGGPPPNSLWALGECLRRGVEAVEIDITPLADSDWLLAHDRDLEGFTTGRGSVASITTADSRALYLVRGGAVTGERPSLLSDALDLVERLPGETLVQLDLKAPASLPPSALPGLVSLVAPVRHRVLISSTDDACLRELRRLAPWVRLGFDPKDHLDVVRDSPPSGTSAPRHISRHGYLENVEPTEYLGEAPAGEAEYLASRLEALNRLVPGAEIWFVRASLLLRAAEALNPVDYIHGLGVKVGAWTVDPTGAAEIAAARKLVALGVDYITTNRAEDLGRLLDAG